MLKPIEIFIKVVEHGNFSRAGKVLNMAPSSITRTIDQLEHEFGVSFFKRSTRQLVLTEQGQIFLESAYKLQHNLDDLSASLKSISAEPEGTLRISVFESFGRIHVAPLLAEFLNRYPKISVHIELENRIVDLNKEDIDIAIRIGTPNDSNLIGRKIISNETSICASPEYIDKYGIPSSPEELAAHNCLFLQRNRQQTYWYFTQNKKTIKVHVTGNLTANGGSSLVEAGLNGLGILHLSKWMTDKHIQDGRLIRCLNEWDTSIYEQSAGMIYTVHKKASYIKPSIKVFNDFLIEKIRKSHFI